jgi:hypothetical protein
LIEIGCDYMKRKSGVGQYISFGALLTTGALFAFTLMQTSGAEARQQGTPPALIVTNDPLPPELRNNRRPRSPSNYRYRNTYRERQPFNPTVNSTPVPVETNRSPSINPAQISGPSYFDSAQTAIGKKIDVLRNELFEMQGLVAAMSERSAEIERLSRASAAEYYAAVATIRTQLQSGTTPGNPRLVQRLTVARESLDRFSGSISEMNDIIVEIRGTETAASLLLDTVRATYNLSGAIEEDHERLEHLEDGANNVMTVVERMLHSIHEDINRTTTYYNAERENLRTLALAIAEGDLFGNPAAYASGLGNSKSGRGNDMSSDTSSNNQTSAQMADSGPRPLVKINFGNPAVEYEQPLYVAVTQALQRYPNAAFDLVGVHPAGKNTAEEAIEKTRSRRNAERVMRSLSQMGLKSDRIDLSYTPSTDVSANEIYLYIR